MENFEVVAGVGKLIHRKRSENVGFFTGSRYTISFFPRKSVGFPSVEVSIYRFFDGDC